MPTSPLQLTKTSLNPASCYATHGKMNEWANSDAFQPLGDPRNASVPARAPIRRPQLLLAVALFDASFEASIVSEFIQPQSPVRGCGRIIRQCIAV